MAAITDSSNRSHSSTLVNGAVISRSIGKFDNSSIELLSGIGRSLTIPDSDDWYFGSNPFTIELFARFASVQTESVFISQWSNQSSDIPAWALFMNGGRIIFRFYNSSATLFDVANTFTPLTGVFYHIAVDRDSNNNFRLYVDGKVIASENYSTSLVNGLTPLNIGTVQGFEQNFNFNGHLDEIRITKGTARYAGPFSPIVASYGDYQTDQWFGNVVLLVQVRDPVQIIDTHVQSSQLIVEVINQHISSLQSSQSIVEVISQLPTPKSQVSQVVVEVIMPNMAILHLSQSVVEVIRPNIDKYPSYIMLFG